MHKKENKRNAEKKELQDGMRAVWRHSKPFKNKLIILFFLGLISAAANGFIPYITGHFLDALIAVSQHTATVAFGSLPLWAFLLGTWATTQLIANSIDWSMDRLRRNVSTGTQLNIQADGFLHLLRVPVAYHKSAQINGVLEQISSVSWRVADILRTITNIAPQFLSVIIGITLAASINTALAGVLLAGVFLYVLLLIRILLPIAAIDSAAHRAWSYSWNDAASAVQQIDSVKQAVAENYETKKVYKDLLGRTFRLWRKLEETWSNVNFFQRMVVLATQFTVFFLSVHFVSGGVITVGELVALNGYALMFFGPFVELGYGWQTIQNGIIKAAHAEKIFQEPEEVYMPDGAVSLEHISGRVQFNNVTFRYEKGRLDILTNFNLDIKPGEIVAFVGESGVGKSTAISLISAYSFPSKGNVLIDGIDTRKLNLTNLRKQIGVVPQEVALFNDTIKENIRYGSFDASDEDVARAAKRAHIDEFIATLPQKYNTLVGERGMKLSVGQKQRVAIARAMLRNPKILILDEPTSALDSKTEQFITESLEELMRGRTTFIIAHRLSTVRKADKIFFIEDGKIAEEGSHDELMKIKNGRYREMYELHIGLHE